MEGFEYLYQDDSQSGSLNQTLSLVIVLISMFAIFPLCMLTSRCEKKKQEPLLPVTDNMIHSHPTADNPFLKLRVVSYSAAEDKKPTIIV